MMFMIRTLALRSATNDPPSQVSPGPRRRRIGSPLTLILIGALLGLIVAEIAFRLIGIGEQGMYQWDADRGWALRPGASEWQRREGNAFVQVNREGMRDREHSFNKPKDTIRIAFIGDSFTEAEQVAIQDGVVSVAERRLQNCARLRGKKVEALNFGCDGYGTAQEIVTLKRDVWKFSPDIVVLLFFAGNDLRNNSPRLEWHLCQPFYLLRSDRLVLSGPFIDSPLFRTECLIKFESRRSAALNVLGDSIARIRSMAKAKKALFLDRRSKTTATSAELGLSGAIYSPPQNQDWEAAWNVTENLLLAMNENVKQHGAQFLGVTATVGPQAYPSPVWRGKFERSLDVKDLLYPDLRIRDLGERAGFPVLNLAPAFQSFADQHHVFLHGFDNTKLGVGHWNEAGHHLAGELIANRLCDIIDRVRGRRPSAFGSYEHLEPGVGGNSRPTQSLNR